jgi:hypothetical protein
MVLCIGGDTGSDSASRPQDTLRYASHHTFFPG